MSKSVEIAVIDDDPSICELFTEALAEDYQVRTYEDGERGLEGIRNNPPQILILDLRLPGKGGLEVLEVVRNEFPEIEVVMVTAHKDVDSAVKAMKLGAFDYIVKPFDLDEINVIIEKVLENKELRKEVEQIKSHFSGAYEHTPLIGRSPAIQEVREKIRKLSDNDTSVLIRGESGTGKEVVANKIHYDSDRADAPLVAVNCAGIPDNLLESELFGHKKGAFTGAEEDKKGKIELADGGTLLLDEIGAMPLEMQAKLLRVLEEKQITPVGGEQPREIDFRLISATSSNLESMIEENEFREDLYYRINVFEIEIEPLRKRHEDIEPLCDYFLDEINKKLDQDVEDISDDALDRLKNHDWPGNVRELRNALESAVVVCDSDVLRSEDFDLFTGFSGDTASGEELYPGMSLEDSERILIKKTLEANDGNITQSAETLGVTRKTLRNKKEKYDISLED